MKLLNLLAYLALVGQTNASTADIYNFKKWGADWPAIEMTGNMCGRRN